MFDFKADLQKATALPLRKIYARGDLPEEHPAVLEELLARLAQQDRDLRR